MTARAVSAGKFGVESVQSIKIIIRCVWNHNITTLRNLIILADNTLSSIFSNTILLLSICRKESLSHHYTLLEQDVEIVPTQNVLCIKVLVVTTEFYWGVLNYK